MADTLYASCGDLSLAYQVFGDGPVELVCVAPFVSHVELCWTVPEFKAFCDQLATFCRVLLFDKAGVGLSDPVPHVRTLDDRAAEIEAVMDAAGFGKAVLFAMGDGGAAAIVFAATRPERTRALILSDTFPFTAIMPTGWDDIDRDPAELRASAMSMYPEVDEKYWPSAELIARALEMMRAVRSAWGTGAALSIAVPSARASIRDADTKGGPGRTLGGGSIVSRGRLIPRTPALQTSSMSLRGTPRGRENGVGSPVDADRFLGRMSPQTSLAPGPDLEGSRIVASSTPVRISVPLTEAPGRPTRWNRTDSIGGQAEMGARRKTKQKPAMVEPVEIPDAEHGAADRAGRGDRCGQGGRQGVCRCPAGRGGGLAGCGTCPRAAARPLQPAEHLVELGIEKVTVESTSDYWRIWYYLLEDQGLDVQLVNARDVKNVPGRPKTDKLDAVWLAKLTEKMTCDGDPLSSDAR